MPRRKLIPTARRVPVLTKQQRILALLVLEPGLTPHAVATRLGCSPSLVRATRRIS